MSSMELKQIDGPPLPCSTWRLSNPFRIGRAASNELELPDPGVSRRHASIERDESGWLVRDCGARRGVRLNELALQDAAAALQSGDVLSVGPWRFRVNAIAEESPRSGDPGSNARISVERAVGNLAEQRLELLLRYAGEIALAADESSLAEIMAEHALLGSGYARATVLWRNGDDLRVRCQRPVAGPDKAWAFNESLVRSAESGDIAHLRADEADHPASRRREGRDPGCALCAPLMLDGMAQAYLYLESDRSSTRRHADAPTFCHALARLAGLALANLQRLESEREHAAVSADLNRAREVQHRLLPATQGQLGAIGYALRLHPGRVVAGDVVDVFEVADGRVVAALGDVSGAGLGAGLVMASVQSFLRAGFAHDADPARIIGLLNSHLCAQAEGGRFVTLWLGVFEADGSLCRYVDAGHGHALRVAAVTTSALPSTGCIPLGIDARAQFIAETLELSPGEILLLYSDGIIEQRSGNGSAWGTQGLAESVLRAGSPADAIALAWAAMTRHAEAIAPEDDSTLLALGRPGSLP